MGGAIFGSICLFGFFPQFYSVFVRKMAFRGRNWVHLASEQGVFPRNCSFGPIFDTHITDREVACSMPGGTNML